MRSLLARVVSKAVEPMLGAQRWQSMWESLERLATRGLGVGSGAEVDSSGEDSFLSAWIASHKTVDRPLVCMDVGANRGAWSALLLRHAKSQGCAVAITAFEPSSSTCSQLRERFAGAQDPVKVENLALGATPGSATLHSDAEGSGLASLYERRLDHFGISMELSETVPVTTLDQYRLEQDIPCVDLLKLDVEGAELEVLHGAAHLLASDSIGTIQFEFGGCNIDSRTYFQDFWYLLEGSYDLFRVVTDGLWPIKRYEERHERFVTTNLVAIHRSRSAHR